MKNYFTITALALCLSPAAFGQDTIRKNQELIQFQNINANGYKGNIVLDVVDENDLPINEYRSVLRSGDDIIFDVMQQDPRSTFYKDGSGLTLEIEKKGYQTYISKPITTADQIEMACVIKIVLIRDK